MNVPAIYTELSVKTVPQGRKVLVLGTLMACIAYIIGGTFGFAAFASGTSEDLYTKIFDK